MKKAILVLGVIGLVGLALAASGVAYAQSQTPTPPAGNTTCPGSGMFAGGMMGQFGAQANGTGTCPAFQQNGGQSPQPGFGRMSGGYATGRGRGMMGGGMYAGGMMGNGNMPMHDYMEAAFAQSLGMTEAELESELAAGKTMWQVAQEKGKTDAEITSLMTAARSQALQGMVAAGTISQEQANAMQQRMDQGAGPGGCPGMGQ